MVSQLHWIHISAEYKSTHRICFFSYLFILIVFLYSISYLKFLIGNRHCNHCRLYHDEHRQWWREGCKSSREREDLRCSQGFWFWLAIQSVPAKSCRAFKLRFFIPVNQKQQPTQKCVLYKQKTYKSYIKKKSVNLIWHCQHADYAHVKVMSL